MLEQPERGREISERRTIFQLNKFGFLEKNLTPLPLFLTFCQGPWNSYATGRDCRAGPLGAQQVKWSVAETERSQNRGFLQKLTVGLWGDGGLIPQSVRCRGLTPHGPVLAWRSHLVVEFRRCLHSPYLWALPEIVQQKQAGHSVHLTDYTGPRTQF